MKKYKSITDFLEDLSPEQKYQVQLLRKCILETEPSLVENIKWNAPNYVYNGADCITFNLMNKDQKVKILIHKGAKETEDKKAEPIFKDDLNLIQWNSNIRGTLTFNSMHEIEKNYVALQNIFRKWIHLL